MWVLYAVLGAFAKALSSVFRKKISKTSGAIYVFISSVAIAVVLASSTLILSGESLVSVKNAPFLLILSGLVQIIALRSNMFAFKHEELSYITPMFALTPLYATLIAYFTIGETPSAMGLLGISAIVLGVYTVTGTKGVGLKDTFRHIVNNKGARAGMLIPLAYAVSGILNKEAINNGVTPLASVATIMAVMGIGHFYVLFTSKKELKQTFSNKKLLRLIFFASLLGVASVGFASLALKDALTSYTLSIRRLDVLITVLIGWKFMGDSNFKRRITGSIIMTAGVVLVSFG